MTRRVVKEVIPIRATTEEVRQCILSADRILQYYPLGNGSGDVEPGRSFYCKGPLGISLFEVLQNDPDYVLLKVHNATSCDPPYTVERLNQAAFFSMLEDWHLEDEAGSTKLTRLWRDFEQHKLGMMPVTLMVRLAAKLESLAIKKYWATVPH
jgi:hypothetical protein